MISYDKYLVQILNWTVMETDAQLIILIRFLRYLAQIILFYTYTHWNLIRFLSLKLRKLFLDNFAQKNDLFFARLLWPWPTNSREINYQNIEKSLSLIIERLVSMATKKITERSDQDCGLYIVRRQNADKKNSPTNILWKIEVITLNDIGSSWNLAQPFPLESVPPPIFFRFFGIYLTIL